MFSRPLAVLLALTVPTRLAPSVYALREDVVAVAPAPTAPVVVDRARPADAPSVAPLRRLLRSLKAPGARVESGPALSHFFDALDGTVATGGRAEVMVFGNSLIASDGVTGVVRERLVERFGDGGRGLVLADCMASYGPRGRTAQDARGWTTANVAGLEKPSTPVGLAGVIHVSDGPAESSFALAGEQEAEVFFFAQEGAPRLRWRCDRGPWIEIPDGPAGPRVERIRLPEFSERFELQAPGARAVCHGVSLERGAGVVLDVLGVPSADAALWLEADEASFTSQLAARRPDLITVMLGANEAKRISWGKATRDSTEESLVAFLERLRTAAPGASCLVVGPGDAVVGPGEDEPFRQRAQLAAVIELERRVALAQGCAFFDLYAAMGGRGAIERLNEAGLMHDDLVHPKGRGLDLLGQLIADALFDAYAGEAGASDPVAVRAQ